MSQQIIIAEQARIAALLTDDRVDELIVAQGQYQIGDIFLGTVENVLPGIDAAFINIGESDKNGFIHVSDLGPLRLKKGVFGITELLEPKQKVLVQVIKEPTGSKGPRLTGSISIPGKYLILQPYAQGVNISRKINTETERSRLKALGVLIKPPSTGLLFRTEAEKIKEELLIEDLEKLISETMEIFDGKIDFVLHSIGMSVNVRKGKHYTDLNHDWLTKGWDVSAVSFHKLLQSLYKMDAMNEWGSIVALSYMAAQRVFPNYNDMADNKAYLESIARSFGYFFGKEKKVRVNTISQSPTPTTAGKGVTGFDGFINYAEKMSPLGNATADECADYTITLFSDLTRKVTLQNLFHDGGFSNVGVSQEVIDIVSKNS